MGQDDLPIRSYSQLSQLEQCGEQYRLKRIVRLPETPAVWFPAGNAFHHITEQFDKTAVLEGVEKTAGYDWAREFPAALSNYVDELIEKGASPDLSTWRTAGVGPKRPKGDDYEWWDENGPDMVRAYIRWRVENRNRYGIWIAPDGTPGIEWEGTALIGGVNVTMRADRILVDLGTGATIIVDLKSGKSTPDSPLQLRVYKMVAERAAGVPMWYGAYYMAREGKLTPPQALDTFNEWAIEARFSIAEELIENSIFQPRPSARNCMQCGFKSLCQFVED